MKVCLVVAQGVHQGKSIPITVNPFLIGRDPNCQLRPASPAVSKQHCALLVREGKVLVRDYGSTNGTFVNNEQVLSTEREIHEGDDLRIGPLEFKVSVKTTVREPVAAAKPAPEMAVVSKAETIVNDALSVEDEDPEKMAAMLLSMDDGQTSDPTISASIPDGSTIMDIPIMPDGTVPPPKEAAVPKANFDSQKAASDLLTKYLRRPRT